MQSGESTAYWINRTSRALQRLMDSRLKPFGFGPSHLPILGALSKSPALTQSQLSRAGNVEQPTMAKLLSRMERDDLVTTDAHPEDRRAIQVSLTRRARTAFPRAMRELIDAESDVMRGLNKSERRQLSALLQRVLHNVETLNANAEADCEDP